MIYTSYYGNFRQYVGKVTIAISRRAPCPVGHHFPELAPSEELLWNFKSRLIQQEEFIQVFNQQLALLDPQRFGPRVQNHVLLCYEKFPEFCHRHLVANWLRLAGFETQEIGFAGREVDWLPRVDSNHQRRD